MPDRFDRFLIAAGCWLHQLLEWLEGRVFMVVDDASHRVMQRSWIRRHRQRRR